MQKLFIALIALAATMGSSALAADVGSPMPAKAPVAAVLTYNWTGFYVGGDVGGLNQRGSGISNFTQVLLPLATPETQSLSANALSGGIHFGHNWQFTPSWVVGVEGDWQWTGARSSFCRQTDTPPSLPCVDTGRGIQTIQSNTQSIGTFRGRFGWVNNAVMLYGTAGVAFAQVNDSIGLDCRNAGCGNSAVRLATSGSASAFNPGWAAGAGVEWMLARSWMVRAEYLHIDAGQSSKTLDVLACSCTASWSHNLRYEIVRAGVSYKFGSL